MRASSTAARPTAIPAVWARSSASTRGWSTLANPISPASMPISRAVSRSRRKIGSTCDGQISYNGIKSIRLTVGVKNLFDRDPPYTNYGAGFVGGYDLSYTDVRGRFVYLTATYFFK